MTSNNVAHCLAHASTGRYQMGVSMCRFCGKRNGSGECSDGVFVWPHGLAHYVAEHQVRLPDRCVKHA